MALQRVTPDKHPLAIIAVPIDLTNLGTNTITAAASAGVAPTGLTVNSVSFSGARVTVLLSSGTSGVLYQVTITADLSNGEKKVQEFEVYVLDN